MHKIDMIGSWRVPILYIPYILSSEDGKGMKNHAFTALRASRWDVLFFASPIRACIAGDRAAHPPRGAKAAALTNNAR